jgi:cell division transport system permease protein
MIAQRLGWTRRVLPLARDDAMGFLPWVLALMVCLAALSALGLIVLHATLRAAERPIATTLTLQVPANASSLRLDTVMALVRRTKGVVSAHLFEPAETARLLAPWLGPAVPLDELPVPRLIDVQIDPADAPDLATLLRQITSVLPEAQLDDHRPWLDAVRRAARWIDIILVAAIVVALLLIATAAVFAVRTALMIQRSAVEVVYLLGAGDAAIARQFAIRYLQLGLLGGAVGAIAALLAVLALGQVGTVVQLPAPAAATGIADWRCWAVLIAVALAAGLIAMASAQIAVLRWLARLP